MANVLHKTADPPLYRTSVNTPDFDSADWFVNPDISAVAGVPIKYWKLTDPVTEMNQAEKDAADAAIANSQLLAERAEAVSRADLGIETRALVEVLLFEINKCNTRLQELQDCLTAVKNTTGGSTNIRAAIADPSPTSNAGPTTFLNVSPKLRSQVLQKYVDDINAGVADP